MYCLRGQSLYSLPSPLLLTCTFFFSSKKEECNCAYKTIILSNMIERSVFCFRKNIICAYMKNLSKNHVNVDKRWTIYVSYVNISWHFTNHVCMSFCPRSLWMPPMDEFLQDMSTFNGRIGVICWGITVLADFIFQNHSVSAL